MPSYNIFKRKRGGRNLSNYDFDLMITRIKDLKKEKKITNSILSELSSIPIGTLNKILGSETKEPSVNAIIRIADALGVSADYLAYGGPKIKDEARDNTATTDNDEKELLATYRELNTDNQSYIRVRSIELLKDQFAKETEKNNNGNEGTKTFKIASRNGKSELELTEEQRKAIVDTIVNHKKTDVGDLI